MTKIYVFCDMRGARANGGYPVYLLFKNPKGTFMVNTGLSASMKFTGCEFHRTEKNRKVKTDALNRYLLKAEEVCLQNEEVTNGELKAILKK